MNALLLNRQIPADGFVHIVPLGEFPHPEGVLQVIDAQATAAIVNRFNQDAKAPNFPGLLLDYDHFSDDPSSPSRAAGWITKLDNRHDGIWAHVEWTPEGKKSVTDGEYRLASPVFSRTDAETLPNSGSAAAAKKKLERLRVTRLLKVALTNDPNLKGMTPLSNREGNPAAADTPTTPNKQTMKTIASKLGLSADASEESILAEVTKLQNRAETAETKVTTLTGELTPLKNRVAEMEGEQCEALLLECGVGADDKSHAHLLKAITPLKNRAERLTLLADFGKKPGAKKQADAIHNRGGLKTPATVPGAEGNENPEDGGQAQAAKAEAAVQDYKLANRCSYGEAHSAVMRQKPELFGLTASRN